MPLSGGDGPATSPVIPLMMGSWCGGRGRCAGFHGSRGFGHPVQGKLFRSTALSRILIPTLHPSVRHSLLSACRARRHLRTALEQFPNAVLSWVYANLAARRKVASITAFWLALRPTPYPRWGSPVTEQGRMCSLGSPRYQRWLGRGDARALNEICLEPLKDCLVLRDS